MQDIFNPNKLIIDRKCIKKNINSIKKYIGQDKELMAIIKADSYGIGINNVLPIINEEKINIIGVSNTQEAVDIRKNYQGNILILMQPMKEQIPYIVNNNVSVNVCDMSFCIKLNEEAKKQNKNVEVHIEIDTGMSRTGIKVNSAISFIRSILKLENLQINGISTHLSSTGVDKEYTNQQIMKFINIIDLIENIFNIKFKYIHAYASGGILEYPLYKKFNTVRTGIMIYGYYPNLSRNIKLYPALTLKSKISFIHEINKGDSIGYNRIYKAKKNMKLAIIPLGFADAFMGLESNIAYVLIKGRKAKIIAICMDTMVIDVTNISNVEINDDVILWDNKNITLEQWGIWTNTSNYEVLSILSKRIDRILK